MNKRDVSACLYIIRAKDHIDIVKLPAVRISKDQGERIFPMLAFFFKINWYCSFPDPKLMPLLSILTLAFLFQFILLTLIFLLCPTMLCHWIGINANLHCTENRWDVSHAHINQARILPLCWVSIAEKDREVDRYSDMLVLIE